MLLGPKEEITSIRDNILGLPRGLERKSELSVGLEWQRVTIQQKNRTDGMRCHCETDMYPGDRKEEAA